MSGDAFGAALFLDLTAAPGTQRTVAYDINTGWSWGGFSWAQQVPLGTDILPLLVDSSRPPP